METTSMKHIPYWIIIALLLLGKSTRSESDGMEINYTPLSTNIVLGLPLDGCLTVTNVTYQEFLGATLRMIVTHQTAEGATHRQGLVRTKPFRISKKSPQPCTLTAIEGAMPGIVWIASTNVSPATQHVEGALIFPESGIYDISFSIGACTSNLSRIQVAQPTGENASAWQDLPKNFYCEALSARHGQERIERITNGTLVPGYLTRYSKSFYAQRIAEYVVSAYEDRSEKMEKGPKWLRDAYELATNIVARPLIFKDLRSQRKVIGGKERHEGNE